MRKDYELIDRVINPQGIRERFDFCCDLTSIMAESATKIALIRKLNELISRGIKVRGLAEITKENASVAKEIINYCDIRHTKGIYGFLAIADEKTVYGLEIDHIKGTVSPKHQLYSSSKSVASLQQRFFDSIWASAITATSRLKQLEEGIEPEVTEIITGWNPIIQRTIDGFLEARRVDHCCDALVPPRMASSPANHVITDFSKRGGRVRMITEITKDNLDAVKELMKSQEIRHISGFKLNFGVSDKMFSAPTSVYSLSSEPQCIWSNSKQLLKEHQYLFDKIWDTAVPANLRIREIELGIADEILETIIDRVQINKLALGIIGNATKEIHIVFPTTAAFLYFDSIELLGLAERMAASKHDFTINIITPEDELVKQRIRKMEKHRDDLPQTSQIKIKTLEFPMQMGISIIVADKTDSLSIEFKVFSDSNLVIGPATHSNNRSTVSSYVSFFDSIWTQAQLYEELRHMYEQAQLREKLQMEFINVAAHELRSPLQPILGLSKILRRHASDTEERQLLDVIIRNAVRLNHLQQEILDAGKIDRNQFKLSDIEMFDLNQLVVDMINDLKRIRAEDENNEATMIDSMIRGKLWVKGDKSRLTQVISNMLDNALKFTKRGIVKIITSKSTDGWIEVIVVDSGQGIDPEIMPKLFTKFVSKSGHGTGLGLYISKAIIEAHGGKIWAENNNGDDKGASFHFALPSAENMNWKLGVPA